MALLSIIVPTYNEKGNMEPLLTQLCAELDKSKIPFEVLVMDDNSPDKTADEVARVAKEHNLKNVSAVVRTKNRGLSPSVIDGFDKAKGDILLVMDADLSHPITAVPSLYKAITEQGADISVGSRHCKGGGIVGWPAHRKLISFGASLAARPLTTCTDPMAGFFCFRREVIKGAKLNAAGYKILLEVLVKGTFKKLIECPIMFKDREIGESKLTKKVMIEYITHLIQLYMFPGSAPFFKFLFVGALGALIDISIFTMTRNTIFGGKDTIALSFSFLFSLVFNFFMNRMWTFKAGKKGDTPMQFVKFALVGFVCLLLRTFIYRIIMKSFGISDSFPFPQMVLVFVIAIVSVVNFIVSRMIVFKSE